MHSKGRGPSDPELCASPRCQGGSSLETSTGEFFFLFDRLLGLYSSLHLEGMTRISFLSHCSFPSRFVFGWLVLLASIDAALPVAFQSSSGCCETTGKYSIICTGLGLLLHHGVEVRVLHGLFGSQSLLMVVSQKFVQKI